MVWGLSYIYYVPKVHGWQGTCYCIGHQVVGAPKCTFTIQGEEADEELNLRKTKHWLNGAPHYATRSDHMKKWGKFVRDLDASQVPDYERLEKDKFTEDATMLPLAREKRRRDDRVRKSARKRVVDVEAAGTEVIDTGASAKKMTKRCRRKCTQAASASKPVPEPPAASGSKKSSASSSSSSSRSSSSVSSSPSSSNSARS